MSTLADRRTKASAILARYMDPTGLHSFHTYDRQPANQSDQLLPEDVLAANLLSLRLGTREVIPLFAEGPEYAHHRQLLHALNSALVAVRQAAPFESYPTLDELDAALEPMAAANRATRGVPRWTPVTVSKVLHRHAPHVVPIVDSRIRAFYGLPSGKEHKLRHALWEDIRKNLDWLGDTCDGLTTPDGRPLSILRAADILIWSPEG